MRKKKNNPHSAFRAENQGNTMSNKNKIRKKKEYTSPVMFPSEKKYDFPRIATDLAFAFSLRLNF